MHYGDQCRIRIDLDILFSSIFYNILTFPTNDDTKGTFIQEYVLPQLLTNILKSYDPIGIKYRSSKEHKWEAYDECINSLESNICFFVPYSENNYNNNFLSKFYYSCDTSRIISMEELYNALSKLDFINFLLRNEGYSNSDTGLHLVSIKMHVEDMIKYNADEYDGYGLKFMLNAKEKNMEEALKTLETAKAVFNDYSPLKLDYVKYHIVKEQYDEALEIISSINEEDAYYEDFIICKAKILSFKGKDAEAIELLNDDLVYNEENSELIFMLALLNYKTSRLENAFNNLDILCNMEDLNNDYCKMAVILKGYALREKGQEQEAIEQFKEAYKILKIQNLSNPYDINTLLYRCITLIEAKEYKKCHEILNGIDRLGEENYLKKADEIRKLMAIKKDEKKDHIILEKEIITGILDKR